MKHLIFILLKIAELSLLPLAYFIFSYLGWIYVLVGVYQRYGEWDIKIPNDHSFGLFLIGLLFTAIAFCVVWLIVVVIKHIIPDLFELWIDSNKKWSENISKWLKSRFS